MRTNPTNEQAPEKTPLHPGKDVPPTPKTPPNQ